jgi:hypothetical protein
MITLGNLGIEECNEDVFQEIINQVAMKVHNLESKYKKISKKKLPAKLEDIFEPTVKISIGANEIAALCDLGASVSTIPKSLFQRLNLGSFEITELKLRLSDSTYKQVVGIKHNVLVQIKGCPALTDFVIVDMPRYAIAPIILGRPFLRTIKTLIKP